jgi:hypothetical protein
MAVKSFIVQALGWKNVPETLFWLFINDKEKSFIALTNCVKVGKKLLSLWPCQNKIERWY